MPEKKVVVLSFSSKLSTTEMEGRLSAILDKELGKSWKIEQMTTVVVNDRILYTLIFGEKTQIKES